MTAPVKPETLTDEMIRALDPAMAVIAVTNSTLLSEAGLRVLRIACRNGGFVAAGTGAYRGSVERVSASAVLALARRGYLIPCYAAEGGVAGRLSTMARQRICDAINARRAKEGK